jgi:hypothetical protein
MPQNETQWVLETVLSNWPDPLFPSDLVRLNNDRPEVLASGRREKDIELTKHNVVRAGLGDRSRELRGTESWYRIETIVDVGVEAAHDSVYGHVADENDFDTLVDKVQRAIDDERNYPTVSGTGVGEIAYHTVYLQNEMPGLAADQDHYRSEFEVVLKGKQER